MISNSNGALSPPHKIERSEDRLSNLPDDVITHILSRMPAKDAFRTSILSKSWESKWTNIYDIVQGDVSDDRSIGFVDKILLSTRDSTNTMLRSFRITVGEGFSARYCYDPCFIERWILDVLKRKVQYLEIEAPCMETPVRPWCFYGWTSLSELKLWVHCTFKVPANSSFPNLKKLSLGCHQSGCFIIETEKDPTTCAVILMFPVLEVLELVRCEWSDVKFVEIHAPELICLRVQHLELEGYEIKISAEKLDMIEFSRVRINNFVLSAPAVTYFVLDHLHDYGRDIAQLHAMIEKFPVLKRLRLQSCFTIGLVELGLAFPTIDQIRELRLHLTCNWKRSMELLQVLPPLQVLEMDVSNYYDPREPLQPKIACNLEDVKFLGFGGYAGQYELVKLILENAKGLRKMFVGMYNKSVEEEDRVKHRLSKLMPRSSSCVLVVRNLPRPLF